jgi:ABC-2 type transport system ATP-binding protein
MSDAITLSDLVVHRGSRRVLHDLTFAVPTGSVTGLLGPSGSGKTTAMRAIVGAQIVRSGTVTVLGLPAGAAALRSRVGYVTQSPSVYPDLTVRENVRHFAALYGRHGREADSALSDVGLSDAAGQLVRDLSGGQQSRISLACALVGDPEVLILDEPTVGLDPVLRVELWERFHGLAADGATLVVSSHVMDEAGRCDRLILLREGRLLADCTPAELRAEAGTDDLEEAFLQVVRARERVGVSGQGREHHSEAAADREGASQRGTSEERTDRGGGLGSGARSGAPRGSEQESPA